MGGPTGTVTFLFTDIEGSTRLWESAPQAMRAALERHDEIVRSAIEANDGYVFSTGGDGFAAAFARAGGALGAALTARAGLEAEAWPDGASIRVRMALHTGEVVERDGDYFGTAVNRVARLMALAHGGQVLASATTAGLIDAEVPLVDLGDHRLRDLSVPQRVYQVGGGSFLPLRSSDATVGNLPAQLTSFIGRDEAVRDVVGMIGRERLVTLTGPGGVGKTRLALQAAADVAPAFADGVWAVELGGVTSGTEVPAAVGAALRVPQQPGRTLWGSVCDACTHRDMLLVLDNCEHLAGAVAGLVTELLSSAPAARVLATSREALGVRGERLYPVAPLRAGDEAVALFVDRAQAVKPGFCMTDANARAVGEVCLHLDGIPLAVELAAARVVSMTPDEIMGHLDERFRLLRAGPRADLERHQTLRAAIDWSYDALDDRDRAVFAALSVFAGGFTVDAAQVVLAPEVDAWDVLDAVESLVSKSLLGTTDLGGSTRYQLLETVRHYAADRLAEQGRAEVAEERHAAWVRSFAEGQAGPGLRGPEEAAWVSRLAAERDNVIAAVDWAARAHDTDTAARIVAGLGWHLPSVDRLGLADLANAALEIPGISGHALFPVIAGPAASALVARGDLAGAIALSQAAIAAERDGEELALVARSVLTLGLLHTGEADRAAQIAAESLALAVERGDPWSRVFSQQTMVGFLRNQRWRTDEELYALASEAVAAAQELGSPSAMACAMFQRGVVSSTRDPQAAIHDLEECLRYADLGAALEIVWSSSLGYLARCYAVLGDRARAAEAIRRIVLMARDRGAAGTLALALDYGGQALITLGHDVEGATFLGAVTSGRIARRTLGGLLLDERLEAQETARARLGQDAYDTAVSAGSALTMETALAYAIAVLAHLGASSS